MGKKILAVDLFCGAGGTSTGLIQAARKLGYELDLAAINHWKTAIETHAANYPWARHFPANLDSIIPREVFPGGYVDLLVASPECTHHSNAAGGRPRSDQSRASAWHVLRWAEALYIENILIENVKEFMSWGPLDKNGQPIQALKGQTFLSFINSLKSLGYDVDYRLINAANYGDATTRERLFIMASRDKKISWPDITHSKENNFGFLAKTRRWKTAKDIIDWDLKGESIYKRKRPLAPNTMRRIMRGLEKFGGLPFVIGAGGPSGAGRPQGVDMPLGTVLTENHKALCEPYIVMMYGTNDARSINRPLPTVTASSNHMWLCEPFLVEYHGAKYPGDERVRSVETPLPTIDTSNRFGLCQPYIIALNHGRDDCRSYSIDRPMPTTSSVDAWGIAQPFLVKYNKTGDGAISIDKPLDTITGKDRFGLVVPQSDGSNAVIDILFRMLQPHELAAAMSFPKEFRFTGTRDAQVKQIGNAVAVKTAEALCEELLR